MAEYTLILSRLDSMGKVYPDKRVYFTLIEAAKAFEKAKQEPDTLTASLLGVPSTRERAVLLEEWVAKPETLQDVVAALLGQFTEWEFDAMKPGEHYSINKEMLFRLRDALQREKGASHEAG